MFIIYVLLVLIAQVCLVLSFEHDYCSDKYTIISDLSQEECDKKGPKYYYKPNFNDCFPKCVFIDDPAAECGDDPGCPPGYYCDPDPNQENPRCLIDESSCFKYHYDVENSESNSKWTNAWDKPTCLDDGKYAPKQCKGEEANGRCFCSDDVGNRIYGSSFSAESTNMTCACSRRRAELEKDPITNWFISLHCDELGNYEPLQCNLGECWCVEPKTGDMLSAAIPENMLTYLPCYDKKDNGEQYLRQCDSHLYANALVRRELTIHGTTQVNFNILSCDPDGTYGAYRVQDGQAYCTWKDNANLGSWQTSVANIAFVNCYCARDSRIFTNAGLTQYQICSENGNYRPFQTDQGGNGHYCVDKDGFQKSDLQSDIPTEEFCAQQPEF